MIGIVLAAAVLLVIAVGYLMSVLGRRFPLQTYDAGDWSAPLNLRRWTGREPAFDRTVNSIEKAKTSRTDWESLLSHLDGIADEVDPNPNPGFRRVVPFNRGLRFWIPIDQSGAPRAFDRNYLNDRLAAIERHTRGASNGR